MLRALLCILHKSEELINLLLISLFNPTPCINHRKRNMTYPKLILLQFRYIYLNVSLISKFDRITIQIDQNLHNPILIRVNYSIIAKPSKR